ncbi:MAG: hypothetical protein AB1497_08165 [Bacillota bacterium]
MVVKARRYCLEDMAALIGWDEGRKIGAATFHIAESSCQLVSIDAFSRGQSVGSALLAAVEDAATWPAAGE